MAAGGSESGRGAGRQSFRVGGRDVFGGLDLSATRDLACLVLISCDIRDDVWHVQPTFWLPAEGLADKARSDRIHMIYGATMVILETTPGSSVSYEYVARCLRDVFDRHRVGKIALDRWNIEHLKPWLLRAGFSEQLIKDKFVPFGQCFKDISPALRDLESVILEKKLHHGDHVRIQCPHRMRRGEQSEIVKEASDRPHRRRGSAYHGIWLARLRTAVKFDVEVPIA